MSKRKGSKFLLNPRYSSEWDIFLILKELYMSTFKWEGLPPSVNTRFLEEQLFENGFALLVYDDELEEVFGLGGTLVGLDMYREPKYLRAIAPSGYNNTVKNNLDGVVIYDNNRKQSPIPRLQWYARRIYNLERTIDVNVQAQKTPFMIVTDSESKKFSLNQIMTQIDEFEPFIMVDKTLMTDDTIKVIKTDAPFVADKLEELKRKLWNEVLSFIGIENNFSEKSERLTKNEVLVSNGLSIANKNSRLLARHRGLERYNQVFGESYGHAKVEIVNVMYTGLEGGGEDGEIYDRVETDS